MAEMKQFGIDLELDDAVAQGHYSNLAIISHSTSEFIIDFATVLPGVQKARVKSRIILTPEHAKRLLRSLQDFLSKNGMSLADMGMTPRVIEQEEAALGKLAQDGESQQSLLEYSQRQALALENLADLAKRANAKKQQDPVLIEYQQQNGGEQ